MAKKEGKLGEIFGTNPAPAQDSVTQTAKLCKLLSFCFFRRLRNKMIYRDEKRSLILSIIFSCSCLLGEYSTFDTFHISNHLHIQQYSHDKSRPQYYCFLGNLRHEPANYYKFTKNVNFICNFFYSYEKHWR